jgi:opacity protein-like surface antigen
MRSFAVTALVFALSLAGTSTVEAQDSPWRDIAVSASRIDYDLSGTGNAPALAIRTTRNLSGNVNLELRGTFAKPDQQFGPSTLFMPEAQLQYHWNLGRVSPYVGAGIGTAMVKSDFHTDWDPTLSFGAGTGVRLTDRLGVTGELRLRGHEWRFTGTTAEISAGLVWRLPAF